MSVQDILKKQFPEIQKAFFEKEAGANFLRIEVKFSKLTDVVTISKEISEFLDENDPTDGEYYLDIYSAGTDTEIQRDEIKNNIDENIQVKLVKSIKGMDEFIGTLIDANENTITIKWNAKGQFRKQEINIDNLKTIRKYSKIKR